MHCVIHKEILDSQKMSPEPKNILQDVIKINHIKIRALNSHLFSQLSEEMDAKHICFMHRSEMAF